MKIIILPIAAMSILGACTSNTSVDPIPEIEVTSFASYAIQENGDVVLSGSEGEITITAAELANFRTLGGSVEELLISPFEQYVKQSSDNVAVAAGSTGTDVFTPEAIFTSYGGIAGETVVTPTSGSTEYQGTWAAAVETDHFDVHTVFGDLTLSHSFEDNSITGAGRDRFGGTNQVLSIDAVAGAGGDITGTATFDGYGPDYIRTGDLTAGFFGEGATEIAGVYIGDGIAGTMLADRQPE